MTIQSSLCEWRPIAGGLIYVRKRNERNEEVVARYRDGETLDAIGKRFGVTRERIRQIIFKHSRIYGLVDGGVRIRTERKRSERAAAREAQREARVLKNYGCSLDIYYTVKNAGGVNAYMEQRNGAKRRGIDWRFTLATWWRCWQDSECWRLRGRGGDSFVMARFGDVGPYSVDNVYFTTGRENVRDYQASRKRRIAEARV